MEELASHGVARLNNFGLVHRYSRLISPVPNIWKGYGSSRGGQAVKHPVVGAVGRGDEVTLAINRRMKGRFLFFSSPAS